MHSLSLGACALVIPFTQRNMHAAATRVATQTLWVEAADADGNCGYGEACPRVYATGESLDDAIAFVRQHGDAWCDAIGDVASLRDWVAAHAADIDEHPAAWCAVELALLDLFGRRCGVAVETLLDLPPIAGSYRYTAMLGDVSEAAFARQLHAYVVDGFDTFKIRLCGVLERDRAKVEALVAAGIAPGRVRADASHLWTSAREAVFYLRALGYPFVALEEPVSVGAVHEMAEIGRALDCAIVLDESLTRIEHLASLPSGARYIVNLRVSKMGGLLRTLAIARAAVARSLPIIVGAHVGETSVLTRAALAVVQACREHVIAQEGAFGRHLLAHDVVLSSLGFGAGGLLDASAVPGGPGFGLRVVASD